MAWRVCSRRGASLVDGVKPLCDRYLPGVPAEVPGCIRSIRRRCLRQERIAGFFHGSRGPARKMAIRLMIRHRVYATGRFRWPTSRRATP